MAALGIVAWTLASLSQIDETAKIMPFVHDASSCKSCHASGEQTVWLNEPTRSCSTFCLTCHKEMGPHHTVGSTIETRNPVQFVLTSKKTLACITCHDLKTNRYDSKPWKSESLFGSIFQRGDMYKTFYLVERNNRGQLCRQCH
jgi:hypothetical protein